MSENEALAYGPSGLMEPGRPGTPEWLGTRVLCVCLTGNTLTIVGVLVPDFYAIGFAIILGSAIYAWLTLVRLVRWKRMTPRERQVMEMTK